MIFWPDFETRQGVSSYFKGLAKNSQNQMNFTFKKQQACHISFDGFRRIITEMRKIKQIRVGDGLLGGQLTGLHCGGSPSTRPRARAGLQNALFCLSLCCDTTPSKFFIEYCYIFCFSLVVIVNKVCDLSEHPHSILFTRTQAQTPLQRRPLRARTRTWHPLNAVNSPVHGPCLS